MKTTLATVATLTLSPTSTYLVWAKVVLDAPGAPVARDVGCDLTTGDDGSLTGGFDSSFAEIPTGASETISLQGSTFVFGTTPTTIRLQCQTAAGSDALASARFQAIKVATLTVSP